MRFAAGVALLAACLAMPPAAGAQPAEARWLDPDSTEVILAAPAPLYGESHALLIGIEDYTAGWPDLPGVARDLADVRGALEAHGFTVETARNCTRARLEETISNFINTRGQEPDGRLVFYFLGHGHTLTQAFGSEMGYLVPADAPSPRVDEAGFRARALDMQQFEVYARRIQARHALFVFDSCFSGSIFSTMRGQSEFIRDKAAKPVRLFITSGSANEMVPDRGVFSPAFAEALGGAADLNDDGFVSGTELGEFLQERVINYSRGSQHPQYGRIRDPYLDKGDILFSREPATSGGVPVALSAAPLVADSRADDFVVAVAPFYGAVPRAQEDGLVLKQLVERQLYDHFQGDARARVVRAGADLPVRSHDEARRLGAALGASVVIWGEVAALGDNVEIRPCITRLPTFERLRHPTLQMRPKLTQYPDALRLARLEAAEAANIALLMGGEYYQYRDAGRALAMLEAVQPPNAESLRFRALIHYEANQDTLALRLLDEAMALDPGDLDLAILRSRILSDGGDFETALTVAEDARRRDPQSARPLIQLGSLCYDMGRYEQAFAWFEQALKLPQGRTYADCIRLGFAQHRLGHSQDALAAYARAAELDPGAAEPIVRAAVVHHAMGDSRSALSQFEHAWRMTRWTFVGNQMGGIRISLGEYEQGLEILREVLEIEPTHPYAMQNLGNALALTGRIDEAVAVFRNGVRQHPDLLQLRLYLHLALCRAGHRAEAETTIRGFTRDPADTSVSALAADFFAGRLDEAGLLAAADTGEAYGTRLNLCEAHYFLGLAHLVGGAPGLQPDARTAREHFEACVATEIYRFVEYDYAKAELKALAAAE